ncbi:Transmembrane emp24 domain-containing protein p24delta7 [Raphanus sativus]|uniref:Transmembrane emp24 domain-containing protein p24delta7-like n=1 Tax=Raphanus sativus TaxID=3726 RepID=A0A9W3CAL2_RAPSA|nr:transmembrane emp24 domain-containing protein p24delta7-like [Raphanus sativus]KAJ4879299.1 Transmembrane emp24 domain-containing protein p24delta7 [Raphanus sativus]
MDLHRSSTITLLILSILSPATLSMRYELHSGHTKCISEEIHVNAMSVGKYSIVNPHEDHPLPASHKITVKVTSPQGTVYHEADGVSTGHFSLTAVETGDYITCFSAVDHKPETVLTIDFDWRTGIHSKDWSNVAKLSQVENIESEVKKLLDTVTSIHDEMFYLRDREEEMHELNISTNSKMAWLSFMSLGVCLSVAGLQFWHLKTFFQKKKLI